MKAESAAAAAASSTGTELETTLQGVEAKVPSRLKQRRGTPPKLRGKWLRRRTRQSGDPKEGTLPILEGHLKYLLKRRPQTETTFQEGKGVQ